MATGRDPARRRSNWWYCPGQKSNHARMSGRARFEKYCQVLYEYLYSTAVSATQMDNAPHRMKQLCFLKEYTNEIWKGLLGACVDPRTFARRVSFRWVRSTNPKIGSVLVPGFGAAKRKTGNTGHGFGYKVHVRSTCTAVVAQESAWIRI